MTYQAELEFARKVARAAGDVAMQHFGKVERLTKRNAEAVTEADRACQRVIVEAIRSTYPDDGIVGEENDDGRAITFDVADPAGRVWVIDPIDGTNNFISGFQNFAMCVGLLDAGQPVMGVVHHVTRDHCYSAAKGCGAWLNDQPIKVVEDPLGPSAIVMLTSSLLVNGKVPGYVGALLGQTHWKVRIMGSAAIEAAAVAEGVAHTAVTLNGKLWDVAAPAAIVLEAGGKLTSPTGESVFPFDLSGYTGERVPFYAASPSAYDEMLEYMKQHP